MALEATIVLYECGCKISGPLWLDGCKYHLQVQKHYPLRAIMASIILNKHPEELDAYEDQLVITAGYARDSQYDEIKIRGFDVENDIILPPTENTPKFYVDKVYEVIDKTIKCKHKFHQGHLIYRKECPWCHTRDQF